MSHFTRLNSITWEDFEFDQVSVRAYSTRGAPYTRWVPVGMPKLPPQVIDSVFYLYRTEEDARASRDAEGTGFFVSYPSSDPRWVHVYAVSNWHVVRDDVGASVIRVNTRDGLTDPLVFDPSEWICRPQSHDLAIVPVSFDHDLHLVKAIHASMFLRRSDIIHLSIDAGDDAFMVGHFADFPGVDRNVPALRFGHISAMPQPVPQKTGSKDPSFIIDLHSRSGYSGSPVFVYRTVGSDLTQRDTVFNLGHDSQFLRLLGIHWAQFPEKWEILDEAAVAPAPPGTRKFVKGWSGMTCVIPAWDILDLLECDKLKTQRSEKERAIARQSGHDMSPVAESAAEPTSDSNPEHREAFNNLLGAAAKTKRSDG